MNEIRELHNQAMEFADKAFLATKNGEIDTSKELIYQALKSEKQAAMLMKDRLDDEPSRSILFRSAASFAMEYGDNREAEKLASLGLAGNPPKEIIEELRDLLEQINFSRHLEVNEITLDKNEMQLSLAGSEIGLGWASSDLFINRVKDFEKVVFRTVERLLGVTFRKSGPPSADLQRSLSLYLVAPRPGSFKVTLRLGKQKQFDFADKSEEVMDEIIKCFKLISEGREEKLKDRISDTSYYENFIGLASRIAPDGEKIKQVGLTILRDGKEEKVSIIRNKKNISESTKLKKSKSDKQYITIRGRLKLADSTKPKDFISLIDENGLSHKIIVPEGLMNDIVKPLWDSFVEVNGIKSGKYVRLIEITETT